MVDPHDEGGPSRGGQPVKPPLDALEPTLYVALKDFGGIRSKGPKVLRARWHAGERVSHASAC
jgi:hypothetical protein